MRFLPQCRPEHPGEDGLYSAEQARPILVIGKSGTLGRAFGRLCDQRGLYCHCLSRSELDIAVAGSVAAALEQYRPWAVINAAGYVRIDDAEEDWRKCFRENTFGPSVLARECALRGVALVTFSSDMVFDGTKGAAYGEGDRVCPVNVYGMTKASAEKEVLRLHRRALVIRTSAFFGPWDEYNFVTMTLRRLASGEEVEAASDLVVSPTYVPDLVNNALDLLLDGESGIWHMSNCGSLSWAELALSCAKMAGFDHCAIVPRPSTNFSFRAKRPPFSALVTTRGARLPDLDDALRRYFCDAPSVR